MNKFWMIFIYFNCKFNAFCLHAYCFRIKVPKRTIACVDNFWFKMCLSYLTEKNHLTMLGHTTCSVRYTCCTRLFSMCNRLFWIIYNQFSKKYKKLYSMHNELYRVIIKQIVVHYKGIVMLCYFSNVNKL